MNSKMRNWFFPPRLRELLEEGASIPEATYTRAQQSRQLPEILRVVLPYGAVFLTPAAPGPAPDPSTTGNPAFNSPWSLLGLPTVSFPIGLSADGLPLAVQLVGGAGSDLELLQTAEWCESAIRAAKDVRTMSLKTEPQTADLNPDGKCQARPERSQRSNSLGIHNLPTRIRNRNPKPTPSIAPGTAWNPASRV